MGSHVTPDIVSYIETMKEAKNQFKVVLIWTDLDLEIEVLSKSLTTNPSRGKPGASCCNLSES